MQINSISAFNYSGIKQKRQVSFGELDGGNFEHYYHPYIRKITVPQDKDEAQVNVYTYSPRENKNVLYGTYHFQVKNPESLDSRRQKEPHVENVTVPADKNDVELKIYTYDKNDWKSNLYKTFKFKINRARLW